MLTRRGKQLSKAVGPSWAHSPTRDGLSRVEMEFLDRSYPNGRTRSDRLFGEEIPLEHRNKGRGWTDVSRIPLGQGVIADPVAVDAGQTPGIQDLDGWLWRVRRHRLHDQHCASCRSSRGGGTEA